MSSFFIKQFPIRVRCSKECTVTHVLGKLAAKDSVRAAIELLYQNDGSLSTDIPSASRELIQFVKITNNIDSKSLGIIFSDRQLPFPGAA